LHLYSNCIHESAFKIFKLCLSREVYEFSLQVSILTPENKSILSKFWTFKTRKFPEVKWKKLIENMKAVQFDVS
jgi:hypothetical protein